LDFPDVTQDVSSMLKILSTLSESGTYVAKWKEEVLKMMAALKPFSAFLDFK
jgi:hypothetical protein